MRRTSLAIFFSFLLLSVVLIFTQSSAASSSLQSFLQKAFAFPRELVVSILPERSTKGEIDRLRSENKALLSQKYDYDKLLRENKMLRSQFRESGEVSSNLTPGRLVGHIGKAETPFTLIVSAEGVRKGDVVIIGNNLVGIVSEVRGSLARVATIYNSGFELVAISDETNAHGVIRGGGSSIYFEEVAAQENVRRGDLVVTTGEVSGGVTVPQEYVVGKIVSVKNEAQAAFKTSEVESLIDFEDISQVFIFTK